MSETPPIELPDLSGLKLLVVDDHCDALYITSHLLESCRATVIQASNGIAALAYLERYQPDAVITDLSMPEMDGVQLVRRIRSRFSAEQLPAIVLTAFPLYEIADERRYLFQAFLRKPVAIEQLAKTIRDVIESRAV